MKDQHFIIPSEKVERAILILREKKVMLDTDLADIFGVKTSRLNEQVKRNKERFPEDFMFQLTKEEKEGVIANCDHLQKLKFSPTNPYAFTEHGAVMLSSVLNTPVAVQASLQIVRAFIKMREMVVQHKDLAAQLKALQDKYDYQFHITFEAIDKLNAAAEENKDEDIKPIGFK